MMILSLQTGHDSNLCLLKDGEILTHLEVERISRVKNDRIWKKNNLDVYIKMLFDRFNLSWNDIDVITLIGAVHGRNNARIVSELSFIPQDKQNKIVFVDHHVAHAASSYYLSPHMRCAVVTLDGGGNDGGGLIGLCDDDKIHVKEMLGTGFHGDGPVGQVWSKSMEYFSKTSNGPIGTEGVLMGASGYGKSIDSMVMFFLKCFNMIEAWKNFIPTLEKNIFVQGRIWRHGETFDPNNEQHYFDYSASLQKATEIYFEKVCDRVAELFPNERTVCLSGGVMLNCLAIGKVIAKRFDDIFFGPAISDGGLAIGSALYHYHNTLGNKRKEVKTLTPYMGFSYSHEQVEEALRDVSDRVDVVKTTSENVSGLIAAGYIVSLYQGNSESGRRALGNRSILADPRRKDMKETINRKVKHRHWYRPFAPSVLEEMSHVVFDTNIKSPYMSLGADVREEWREKIPAVTHVDGTARLQTVSKELNERYYDIISHFYKKTGVPVVLNTSFNDSEPIVDTPQDAIRCFLKTEIDYLYMNDYLISKK